SHGSIAEATADLGACRLAQGRIDDAVELYREAVAGLDAHALRNFEGAAPRAGLADALHARAVDGDRDRALDEARGSAEAALKHAKAFRTGFPNAARVMGVNAWLRGDTSAARDWWRKGLDAARAT